MSQKENRLSNLELFYYKSRIRGERCWNSVKRLVGLPAQTGWERTDVTFQYDEDKNGFYIGSHQIGYTDLFLPRRVAYNSMTIPSELFSLAQRFDGRLTTEEDIQKFKNAFTGIDPKRIDHIEQYIATFFRKFPKPKGGVLSE